MLFDRQLQYEHLFNSSNGSEHHLEYFYLTLCERHKDGIYTWTFLTCLYFVFAFPACVTILYELFKAHRRGTPFTPNYFFILNISVMDLVFLVFIPPGLINFHIWHEWTFEMIWNFTYAFNTSGRPLLMACICVDCYMAVVHPVIYHKRKSLTPRVLMVSAVWALTVAIGLVYMIDVMLYYSILSMVPSTIAIIIIGSCDFFILRTLKRSNPGMPNIHPQKQRAIQTVISSLVVTVISYLPPVLLIAIGKPLLSKRAFICAASIPITVASTLGSAALLE